jgi:hypothetical protein
MTSADGGREPPNAAVREPPNAAVRAQMCRALNRSIRSLYARNVKEV